MDLWALHAYKLDENPLKQSWRVWAPNELPQALLVVNIVLLVINGNKAQTKASKTQNGCFFEPTFILDRLLYESSDIQFCSPGFNAVAVMSETLPN